VVHWLALYVLELWDIPQILCEVMGSIPTDIYLWYITLNMILNIKLPIRIFGHMVSTTG
jgi:hypothetical protein